MNERYGVVVVGLGLVSSVLAGCDPVDIDEPALTPEVFESAELSVWPPIGSDASPDATMGARALAPANAVVAPPTAAATNADPFPPMNLEPTDDLMIGWVRWALAQPFVGGSVSDPTGALCGLDQEGPVWFLAGTFGGPVERECDVPAGKQLFFPLVNRWGVLPPEFYTTEDEIEAVLPLYENWFDSQYDKTCSLTLRIDGQELRPDFDSLYEDLYIRVMEPFEIDLHEEHWAVQYFDGGTMPAVGDGHYALVQPLTPGDHVLELGGSICGDYPFMTLATYVLHVG